MKVCQTRKVTFGSLRYDHGHSGGVNEIDVTITRNCRLALNEDGLKFWQIIKSDIKQHEWDYFIEEDQFCLNEQVLDYGIKLIY